MEQSMSEAPEKIEISIKTIFVVIFSLISLYFLYQVRNIILFVFIGCLFMAALNPLVVKLESRKLSRGVSIALLYVTIIIFVSAVIAIVIPPFISQMVSLISQIPVPADFTENITLTRMSLQDIQVIANQLTSVPKIVEAIGSAFSGVIVGVSLLVMSFYLLLERKQLSQHMSTIYKDERKANAAEKFIVKVETQIGSWVRAEITLMLIVGALSFVGLSLLRVPYALALAVVTCILEILPGIGLTMSAIPAVLIAYFSLSPAFAVATAILYIVIQQVEGNVLVPRIMRQAAGLSPVVTITLFLIGFHLGGIAGSALAIPLFLVSKVILTELYKFHNQLD
jgi:predicted PurR-regulated permease PerM